MHSEENSNDASLARCRSGDLKELARVYDELLPIVQSYLKTLGASLMEAEALSVEVLSDCLVGTLNNPPLINKYKGRSSLATWVGAVARNRYLDFVRGQKKDHDIVSNLQEALAAGVHWADHELREERVFESLRTSLIDAFQSLSATDAVLLHLVHGHKVDQRILARALGWSDAKMSRHLSALRDALKRKIAASLGESESADSPVLRDLMEVCGRMTEPL